MDVKVSIQGFEGSFHQEAARRFYGKSVGVIPCATFRELVQVAADKSRSSGGVMAIENSIAGSILPNYTLLQKSPLRIKGEVYLRIRQNLLVNPGVKLEDIREVHSHPMALLQCADYLDAKGWKIVETEDTALSAKHVHRSGSKHIAAIASELAAKLYGLDQLARGIQTTKNNYTRFLVLQHGDDGESVAGANKASVNFETDHSRGSLAKVLTAVAKEGVNLSKLQSFPIPSDEWKYSFHADMEFAELAQFEKTLKKMKALSRMVRVYGIYKNGKTI